MIQLGSGMCPCVGGCLISLGCYGEVWKLWHLKASGRSQVIGNMLLKGTVGPWYLPAPCFPPSHCELGCSILTTALCLDFVMFCLNTSATPKWSQQQIEKLSQNQPFLLVSYFPQAFCTNGEEILGCWRWVLKNNIHAGTQNFAGNQERYHEYPLSNEYPCP